MDQTEEGILQALRCPVDWDELDLTLDTTGNIAWLDWYHCCSVVSVSVSEQSVISDIVDHGTPMMLAGNAQALESVLVNLTEQRRHAVKMYHERGGRLGLRTFLRPSMQNGKHFRPGISRDRATEFSRNGPSLFFDYHSTSALLASFWDWAGTYLDPTGQDPTLATYAAWLRSDSGSSDTHRASIARDLILRKDAVRVAFDVGHPIGASGGSETRHVCFEIASLQSHAYPVSPAEAQRLMGSGPVLLGKL